MCKTYAAYLVVMYYLHEFINVVRHLLPGSNILRIRSCKAFDCKGIFELMCKYLHCNRSNHWEMHPSSRVITEKGIYVFVRNSLASSLNSSHFPGLDCCGKFRPNTHQCSHSLSQVAISLFSVCCTVLSHDSLFLVFNALFSLFDQSPTVSSTN